MDNVVLFVTTRNIVTKSGELNRTACTYPNLCNLGQVSQRHIFDKLLPEGSHGNIFYLENVFAWRYSGNSSKRPQMFADKSRESCSETDSKPVYANSYYLKCGREGYSRAFSTICRISSVNTSGASR
jgi:hypothetical protein